MGGGGCHSAASRLASRNTAPCLSSHVGCLRSRAVGWYLSTLEVHHGCAERLLVWLGCRLGPKGALSEFARLTDSPTPMCG